jgi:hypothetical protein
MQRAIVGCGQCDIWSSSSSWLWILIQQIVSHSFSADEYFGETHSRKLNYENLANIGLYFARQSTDTYHNMSDAELRNQNWQPCKQKLTPKGGGTSETSEKECDTEKKLKNMSAQLCRDVRSVLHSTEEWNVRQWLWKM